MKCVTSPDHKKKKKGQKKGRSLAKAHEVSNRKDLVGSSARVVIEPWKSILVFWPRCPETLQDVIGDGLCGKAGRNRAG